MTTQRFDYFPIDPPGTPSNGPPLIAALVAALLWLSTTQPEPPLEIGHRIGDRVDRIIFYAEESSTEGTTASAVSTATARTAVALPVEITGALPAVQSLSDQPAMPPLPETTDSKKELDELTRHLAERRAMAAKLAGSHGLADAFKEARNDARVAVFVRV
jgi:hypothetical protein